eukprot:gene1828-biopygen18403
MVIWVVPLAVSPRSLRSRIWGCLALIEGLTNPDRQGAPGGGGHSHEYPPTSASVSCEMNLLDFVKMDAAVTVQCSYRTRYAGGAAG